MNELPLTDQLIDEYLHGLLGADEVARVERLTGDDPAWAAARTAGMRRLEAIRAAFPPITPNDALARQAAQSVLRADREHRRHRRRGWVRTVAGFAVAAAVLAAAQLWIANTRPPGSRLEVLGQQALLADAPGSLRVRVVDQRTGQPLPQVPVALALESPDGTRRAELARFSTDATGTGSPRFALPDWPAGSYDLTVSADTADGPDILKQAIQLKRDVRLMLSTDKPVYQPGQTIHARGLALRRPDLKPMANEPALFTLHDAKGNTLFKREKPTSQFGIAAADCELAAELADGDYVLRCRVGAVESSVKLDVRKYVLPKFKVDLQFDRPYYRPGDSAAVKIQGTYFFGQPVADAALLVEARTPNSELMVRRNVQTAADGSASMTFTLPTRLAGRPEDQGDSRLTVTAELTDAAGQKAGRALSRAIATQDLRIEAIPEAGPLVAGLDNLIYVYVATPDGQPVKARVRASYDGVDREATTSELGVTAVPVRASGDEDIRLTATDDAGRSATRRIRLRLDALGDFLVRADRAVYAAGETMHVAVMANGVQPVFIDLLRDGQTLRTEVVEVRNGQGALALDLPAELSGTVELCAYRYRGDGSVIRKMRTLVVKPPPGVQIAMKADKAEYRPGDTARLEFALTDAKGKPAPGALSLAAVDEAVFSVSRDRPGMEQAFYLLEQQLLRPVTTIYPWSLEESLPQPVRNEFELALFSSTARVIESRVRPANSPRGLDHTPNNRTDPHSLIIESFTAKLREFQQTRHVRLDRVTQAWKALGTAGVFAVVVALCQWLGTVRVLLGLGVLGALAAAVMLTSTGIGIGVANKREGADARVTQSEALPPGMARGGTGPFIMKGVKNEPLQVRDQFPETLLWRPELVTDESGRATLEVPLADSITTWRLSAGAVTASGQLGSLQTGVRVFQPFFVDVDLPVSLTRGDTVSVPVVVSNFRDVAQIVNVTLAEAAWFERTGPAAQPVELPARSVRSVHFPLAIRKAGRHHLEVKAEGQGVADAVRRSIEVVPDGRAVHQVFAGTLDQPVTIPLDLSADAIPDSAQLLVRLYPSAFSQLVEGLDAIFQMPYGCFEQTSSTTYPNVLALAYLQRTKQSNPLLEAKARQYIHLGYQRLLTFEHKAGGFDWYGTAPGDVTLTAYGLMEFRDMAQVHDVDPALLTRTRQWLLSKRENDGSWNAGRFRAAVAGGDNRLLATAYVARAVFDGTDNLQAGATRAWLLDHVPEGITDPYTLANVALALRATAAEPRLIAPYLDRLVALKKSTANGKPVWWELAAGGRTTLYGAGPAANIETTALAALALLPNGQQPNVVRGALTWLISQKDGRGTWHSTQATVLALQALTAASGASLGGDRERQFVIRLGEHEEQVNIPASQGDVVRMLNMTAFWKAGGQTLTMQETSNTGSGYQVTARHHVPGPALTAARPPLDVTVQYDRTDITVGGSIRASATLTNTGDRPAPMVILDLPIPGGFAVESADFDQMVNTNQIAKYQLTPRQVIVYMRQLDPGQALTLKYGLKATMPVTVTVPSATAYEYYDPARRGASASARLTATK